MYVMLNVNLFYYNMLNDLSYFLLRCYLNWIQYYFKQSCTCVNIKGINKFYVLIKLIYTIKSCVLHVDRYL
jgi:hypothetical protein